jgi:hypothetical protein
MSQFRQKGRNHMTRLLHLGAIAALLVAMLALAGCSGGGSDDDGTNPPPTTDTGTLSGRVVHADDVNIGVGAAVINVLGSGGETLATGTASSSGNFIVRSVPAGTWTVSVETPNESDYGSQSVPNVRVTANADTAITVPVLRAVDPAPTSMTLSPAATIMLMAEASAQLVKP